jgi:hypothetical protein
MIALFEEHGVNDLALGGGAEAAVGQSLGERFVGNDLGHVAGGADGIRMVPKRNRELE